MILYSIIPVEVVFQDRSAVGYGATMVMEYLGEKVEVEQLPDNRYSIRRVLSTSPKAFLNPQLQPGTIISQSRSGSDRQNMI